MDVESVHWLGTEDGRRVLSLAEALDEPDPLRAHDALARSAPGTPPDLLAVALKEAREESGLTRLKAVSAAPFDVDRHLIPERKGVPAHYHYDLRFMIEADPAEPLVISDESKDLAWVEVARVTSLNPEESMARMVRKTPRA